MENGNKIRIVFEEYDDGKLGLKVEETRDDSSTQTYYFGRMNGKFYMTVFSTDIYGEPNDYQSSLSLKKEHHQYFQKQLSRLFEDIPNQQVL